MSKLEDKVLEVQRELRKTEEFAKFEASFEAMLADDKARGLYESFRDVQLDLNQKQSQGIEVTEAEIEESREQFEALKESDIIKDFMTNEYQLNQLIHEISVVIMKPLEEAYEASME